MCSVWAKREGLRLTIFWSGRACYWWNSKFEKGSKLFLLNISCVYTGLRMISWFLCKFVEEFTDKYFFGKYLIFPFYFHSITLTCSNGWLWVSANSLWRSSPIWWPLRTASTHSVFKIVFISLERAIFKGKKHKKKCNGYNKVIEK